MKSIDEVSVVFVPVNDIVIPDEWREIDGQAIRRLVLSIRTLGLIHPLVVDPKMVLVSGRQRLEAMKRLGYNEVPVVFREGSQELLDLINLDENLVRKALNKHELAKALTRQKACYEKLNPSAGHGGKREKGAKRAGPKSFAEATAEKTGMHKDTVTKLARLGEKVIEMPAAMEGHPLLNNEKELLALSRLEPELQQQVVDVLVADEAQHVDEALGVLGHPVEKAKKKQDGASPSCSPSSEGTEAGREGDVGPPSPSTLSDDIDRVLADLHRILVIFNSDTDLFEQLRAYLADYLDEYTAHYGGDVIGGTAAGEDEEDEEDEEEVEEVEEEPPAVEYRRRPTAIPPSARSKAGQRRAAVRR